MAKLLDIFHNSWYDELNSIAYYNESDYERFIKQYINEIFDDYLAFSFKLPISSLGRKDRKPDMALLRKDYSEWWLIEIELGNHEIKHVREQIEVFVDPVYNSYLLSEKIARLIKKELSQTMEKKRIRNLIDNEYPKVLVIIDDEKTGWIDELKKIGAQVCIFEIYKNTNSDKIKNSREYI